MERLFVSYKCENSKKKDMSCDFSFGALLTFTFSNLLPKKHQKIAKDILLSSDTEVAKKLKNHPSKLKSYLKDKDKIEKAKEIALKVGIDNVFVSVTLERGYYCPVCHSFELQFDMILSWKENGLDKCYRFSHNCSKCGNPLIKLNGKEEQCKILKCPKCGGNIELDKSSFLNVNTK